MHLTLRYPVLVRGFISALEDVNGALAEDVDCVGGVAGVLAADADEGDAARI